MVRNTLVFTFCYLAGVFILLFAGRGLTSAWGFYTGYATNWLQYVPAGVTWAALILPWPIYYYLSNRTPGWHKEVLANGREATAVVIAVQRTGFSQNNVNYARLILDVQPKGEAHFEARFELPELRVFMLDKGDTLPVKFDPQNRKHVLLAPRERHARAERPQHQAAEAAPDLPSQLERLAKLRRSGQLTAEEFEAAKRKLLS